MNGNVVAVQADIKEFLDGRRVQWEEVDDLAAVAGDVDVLYQTRIQKERFQVGSQMPAGSNLAQFSVQSVLCFTAFPLIYDVQQIKQFKVPKSA